MGLRSFLNIERQFSFYGAYHHNPVNVAIHITCVPLIMLTAFVFTTLPYAQIPSLAGLSYPLSSYLPLDLCTLSAITYSILYMIMDLEAGSMLAMIVMGLAALAHQLTATLGARVAFRGSLAVHVVAWIAQFVGHGVYEGRAPALLDNLMQALFLAPIFVWLEVLFMCGYKPELKARVDRVIARELSKFRAVKLEGARERRREMNEKNKKGR
ncbi:hypothetical protein KEM56_002230 [Ascosphaera pollenicola]|nr:hypothetical protein KEM56_002230 [Ascosphaera pollenicola]